VPRSRMRSRICGDEIFIVANHSPRVKGLIGGEDRGPLVQMPIIDNLEQDHGGVLSASQVTSLIDDQEVRMGIGEQG